MHLKNLKKLFIKNLKKNLINFTRKKKNVSKNAIIMQKKK